MPQLTDFEGRDVIASGVEMPGASGGLNKALAVDGLELHHGDRVLLVVDTEVVKVRFDPVKDTDVLQRVHVLRVDNAAQVDEQTVQDALDQQRIKVEEAAGVTRLPYSDTDEADDPDPVADQS